MQNFDTRSVVLPIVKIVKETEAVWTFVFKRGSLGSLKLGQSKPGQFMMLWIPGVDEKPFSIAYDDGRSGEFWLTVAKVGPATAELFKFKKGDLVGIRGPFGTSYKFKAGEHLALVAGGYGAAPLYGVAVSAVKMGCKVEFIVGARSADLLLYKERVRKLGSKIRYHVATDDGSEGFKGYSTELLKKVLRESKSSRRVGRIDRVFACGPEVMMKKAAELALAYGADCQLSLERYMKCGFGVCGQCCMDDSGICVCKDGPVYDGAAALKLREFGRYRRDSVGRRFVL